MSKGFLYVGVTLTAATERFENGILSNLAFSVEFLRNILDLIQKKNMSVTAAPGIAASAIFYAISLFEIFGPVKTARTACT